jgi:hypothetical protein
MTTRNNEGRNSGKSATQTTKVNSTSRGSSTEAQRARLLAALKRGPVDTVRAYRVLDILHAPRRVFELRKQGYDIATVWVTRFTEAGEPHRVGQYVLGGE